MFAPDGYETVKFQQFDQVQLRTVRNVSYLSAPPGTKTSTEGLWSVVAIVGSDLLLAKHGAIIRIPVVDVLKIAAYDIATIVAPLGKITNGRQANQTYQTPRSDHSHRTDEKH